MPYSRRLSELIDYHSQWCNPEHYDDFVAAKDMKAVIDFCHILEKHDYYYQGAPFMVKKHVMNIPKLDSGYMLASGMDTWLNPLVPFDIGNENMQNTYLQVKLPEKGVIASLLKRFLENIVNTKIDNSLLVFSKDCVEHNMYLSRLVEDYMMNVATKNVFAWRISNGLLYATYPEESPLVIGGNITFDISSGPPVLLKEEEIVKYNLMGYLHAIEGKIEKSPVIENKSDKKKILN